MIRVENLSKSYRDYRVLNSLSFDVKEGETLLITGESGCGKTTLLRCIAGLEKADEGAIFIDGRPCTADTEPRERNIAMVFQEPALWNHMNVLANITFGMAKKDRSLAEQVAEQLGIEQILRKYPEEISGGQAKRAALARALAAGKENLLLDEPLTNVDSETKFKILEYLKKTYSGNHTILYVTHDAEEIQFLGGRSLKL